MCGVSVDVGGECACESSELMVRDRFRDRFKVRGELDGSSTLIGVLCAGAVLTHARHHDDELRGAEKLLLVRDDAELAERLALRVWEPRGRVGTCGHVSMCACEHVCMCTPF